MGDQGEGVPVDARTGPRPRTNSNLVILLAVLGGGLVAVLKMTVVGVAMVVAASEAAAPAGDFHSPDYAYSVRLAGTPWTRWHGLARDFPEAEFGAQLGLDSGLVVLPVNLLGTEPHLEGLNQAFLARLGIDYSSAKLRNFREIEVGGLPGYDYEYRCKIDGDNYHYVLRTVRGNGFGYFIAAWTTSRSADRVDELKRAVTRVSFRRRVGVPADTARLNQRELTTHGLVFNDLGLFYYRARQYGKSLEYFRTAFEFGRTDATMLQNALDAAAQMNRHPEALEYLQRHVHRFGDDLDLKAWHAFLLARTGQVEPALDTYAGLFARGYRDDAVLEDYVAMLADEQRLDDALATVEAYLREGESTAVRISQASLLARNGDHERASALLREALERRPFDAEIAYALAEACYEGELYHDAIAVCEQLIGNGFESGSAYHLRGLSELGLSWYRRAKASFEAASRHDPADETIRAYLDHVSGLLGQGSNSSIKEPIEPVRLPAALVARAGDDRGPAPTGGFGAYYTHRSTAIHFERGRTFKTTERSIVRIVNPTGVLNFSSMQLAFDPLVEAIYVNELVVRGPDGARLWGGDVADYYVLDDLSSGMATQDKVLILPVSGLAVGSTLDLTVTRRHLVPPARLPFVEHLLSGAVPVERSILCVSGDIDAVRSGASVDLEPLRVDGCLAWIVDAPAVYRWEIRQDAYQTFLPVVWLSDRADTWSDLAREYLASIAPQLVPDPAASDLVLGADADVAQRIASAARYVQSEYVYKAIEFGRRAWRPAPVSETIRNRYGDCKDHALLLCQMLGAVGVEAHLALVSTNRPVRIDQPSIDQFNHMIVYLPEAGGWGGRFIDCTAKETDVMLSVPFGLADRPALILDEANPRFARIPRYEPGSSVMSFSRDLSLAEDGGVWVEEAIELSGYCAAYMRGALRNIDPAQRLALVQSQMLMGSGVQIRALETENVDNTAGPLVLRVRYLAGDRFDAVGDQIVGRLPAPWERRFLAEEFVENRETPFQVHFPVRYRSTVRFNVPEGYRVWTLEPFNRSRDGTFADWSVQATPGDRSITIECQVDRLAGHFEAGLYPTFQQEMAEAAGLLESSLVLTRIEE